MRYRILLSLMLMMQVYLLHTQVILAGNSYTLTDEKMNDLINPDNSSYTYEHLKISEDDKNITVVIFETYTCKGKPGTKVKKVQWCNIKKEGNAIHKKKTLMESSPNDKTVITGHWVDKKQLHLLCFHCVEDLVYPFINIYNEHGTLMYKISGDKPVKFPKARSKNSIVTVKVSDDNTNFIFGIINRLSDYEKQLNIKTDFIENTTGYYDHVYAYTIRDRELVRLKFKYGDNGNGIAIDNKKNIAIFSPAIIDIFRPSEKKYELSEFEVPVITKKANKRPLFKGEDEEASDDSSHVEDAMNTRVINNFIDGIFLGDSVFQFTFSCRINEKLDSLIVLKINMEQDSIVPRAILNSALKLFAYHSNSKKISYMNVPDYERFFRERTVVCESGNQFIVLTSGNHYAQSIINDYYYNITLVVIKLDKDGKQIFFKKIAIPGIFNSPDVCMSIQNEEEFSFLFLSQFNKENSKTKTLMNYQNMGDAGNHFVLYTILTNGKSEVQNLNTFPSLGCTSIIELQPALSISADKKEIYFLAIDAVFSNGKLMQMKLQ